jgi:hypothetical protein
MRDETLEEAAERHYINCIPSDRHSFISGAKWQQERMYSEEDLREAFHVGRLYQGREGDVNFDKWFKQNKKK